MGKTIIVSNRLPVKIIQEDNSFYYVPSEGGLATGLSSIYKEGNNLWVGWPGQNIKKEEEKQQIEEEEQKQLKELEKKERGEKKQKQEGSTADKKE